MVKKRLILLIATWFGIASPAFAQSGQVSDSGNYLTLDRDFILSGFADAKYVLISPAKWSKNEWLGFAAFTGVSVALYTQDENIRDFFQENRNKTGDDISKYIIGPLGTWYLIPVVGSLYLTGLTTGNRDAETAALLAAKAAVISGGFALVLKQVFQRQRPIDGNPPDAAFWGGPFDGFKYNAFPSGHTTMAFATATTLSSYYHSKPWVAVTSYSLATLVGFSRIYDDKHWSTDVLAGAALGFSVGKLVYNKHQKANKLAFSPYQNRGFRGITVQFKVR